MVAGCVSSWGLTVLRLSAKARAYRHRQCDFLAILSILGSENIKKLLIYWITQLKLVGIHLNMGQIHRDTRIYRLCHFLCRNFWQKVLLNKNSILAFKFWYNLAETTPNDNRNIFGISEGLPRHTLRRCDGVRDLPRASDRGAQQWWPWRKLKCGNLRLMMFGLSNQDLWNQNREKI